MAKPLYEALKGMDPEPLHGTGNLQRAFDPDKCSSPRDPDLNKLFTAQYLSVQENRD